MLQPPNSRASIVTPTLCAIPGQGKASFQRGKGQAAAGSFSAYRVFTKVWSLGFRAALLKRNHSEPVLK